jgi:hypothetical protein
MKDTKMGWTSVSKWGSSHMEDRQDERRTKLRWIMEIQVAGMWNGLNWLRIVASGEL